MKPSNDIEIAMKTDQDEMISQMVEKERGRLFNFIRKYVPDEEEAEDLLQDVFYQLVETYRLMKPVERISSWLFTVARNKITDRFRKKKAVPVSRLSKAEQAEEDASGLTLLDLIPDPSEGPEAAMAVEMIMEELEAALEELPEAQREAFVLHELEGLSFEQISQRTGQKVKTLISRKRYAVLYLRERLQNLYDEFIFD